MFLLVGIRTKERLLSTVTLVGEICGVTAPQSVVRTSTKFTAFFIPLFPVRPSRYRLECGNCGAARAVDAGSAARLAA
ncbi:zinc ribbon domain-containing protein [Couchioplanes caeruleus]|uniref:Zinc-ribbon domain-containing protein n=2 Tax=Couchioplanes caeruleus TaxID=56438 RepID=A0A1K0FDF0_9ACTN|nr:zinc-ribbon domain-containing protein [Couchioplanes caeruleus]OJF10849.1 zinc-ribbon domain-containing protein [Couchioplanes caeruleus subsp. caeruleus]ROP32813.1 hypothetical protein EDD30_5761 [Couchioplanes caeruleus]